jgi:5'-3' exonuclease
VYTGAGQWKGDGQVSSLPLNHSWQLICLPRYVKYVMERIRLLRHFNIEPYIVFDGGPLPAKQSTEQERKRRRAEALAKAKALDAQGKKGAARDAYAKCLDVTPEMAGKVIQVCVYTHYSMSPSLFLYVYY